MSIQDELKTELKSAMRERDQKRLDVVRQIETEISVAKSAPGFSGKIDDELYLSVIAAYSKKMEKAIKEFEAAGDRGREMVEKLRFEVAFLSRWLPKLLDEQATRELVVQAIAELNAAGSKDVGKVMGKIMKSHKGQVDGGLVNRLARELLSA